MVGRRRFRDVTVMGKLQPGEFFSEDEVVGVVSFATGEYGVLRRLHGHLLAVLALPLLQSLLQVGDPGLLLSDDATQSRD